MEVGAEVGDRHFKEAVVGQRIAVESALAAGGAKRAPEASRANDQADEDSAAVQKIGDEGIAAGAEFPGADFRLAGPVRAVARDYVMQVMERHGAFARGDIREFAPHAENANREGGRVVVFDAEAVGGEIEVASFLDEEAARVGRRFAHVH